MLLALLVALATQAPAQDLGSLTEHELVALLPRFGEPDTQLDPATGRDECVPALRELRQRIAKSKPLDLESWRTILIEKGFLRWRKDWPMTEPFAVSLHLPALEQGLSVRLVPRVRDWKAACAARGERTACMGPNDAWDAEDYQKLGPLEADMREIAFDLVPDARNRSWDRSATALVHGLGPITIEVRPTRHMDQVLHRRKSSPPGAEILRALHLDIDARAEFGRQVKLVAHAPTWPNWLACSLELTIERSPGYPPTTNLWLQGRRSDTSCVLDGVYLSAVRDPRSSSSQKLRVHGTFDGALRDWDATQYWAGEIEVPLADLIRR
jgi:hypothetical protein